jgi:hypothetical protein
MTIDTRRPLNLKMPILIGVAEEGEIVETQNERLKAHESHRSSGNRPV